MLILLYFPRIYKCRYVEGLIAMRANYFSGEVRVTGTKEMKVFNANAQSKPKTYRKWPGSERCQN